MFVKQKKKVFKDELTNPGGDSCFDSCNHEGLRNCFGCLVRRSCKLDFHLFFNFIEARIFFKHLFLISFVFFRRLLGTCPSTSPDRSCTPVLHQRPPQLKSSLSAPPLSIPAVFEQILNINKFFEIISTFFKFISTLGFCGQVNYASRIVGGTEAVPHSAPW